MLTNFNSIYKKKVCKFKILGLWNWLVYAICIGLHE